MHNNIPYDQLHTLSDRLLVDVRSTREYRHAHIPGAVSFPLFSDSEYEAIGREYTQGTKERAVLFGIQFASARLPSLARSVQQWLRQNRSVVLYCYRGGYRSSIPFQLLHSLGMPVYKLVGGYKAHRKYVHTHWEESLSGKTWIGLYGNTGCGKTEILKALRKRGVSVLDLEQLANHRGSLIGGVGLGPQPSQKMFESVLHQALRHCPDGPVFVEGESRKIGKLFLPPALFQAMQDAEKVRIDAPLDYRVDLLKTTYTTGSAEELIQAVGHFQSFLGQERSDSLVQRLREKNFRSVIEELLTTYYDPRYRTERRTFAHTIRHADAEDAAERLIQLFVPAAR